MLLDYYSTKLRTAIVIGLFSAAVHKLLKIVGHSKLIPEIKIVNFI